MEELKLPMKKTLIIHKPRSYYCPVCDRPLTPKKKKNKSIDPAALEKLFINHFNTRHESLCRQPTPQEIAKFLKGTVRSRGSVATVSGGRVSPR